MEKIIKEYISNNNQEFQRYNSWNHCYNAFGNHNLDNDTLALNLGFYLASWGMYRGSSGLLQKDYKIHCKTVEIIQRYNDLRCSLENEVNQESIPRVLEVIGELKNYYKSFEFETSKGKERKINPTDTLISKILLGTLGCVPAFDRFFNDGVKKTFPKEKQFISLSEKNLIRLFEYVEHKIEFNTIQKKHPKYPKMKLVDMYFWQIGFDNYDPNRK